MAPYNEWEKLLERNFRLISITLSWMNILYHLFKLLITLLYWPLDSLRKHFSIADHLSLSLSDRDKKVSTQPEFFMPSSPWPIDISIHASTISTTLLADNPSLIIIKAFRSPGCCSLFYRERERRELFLYVVKRAVFLLSSLSILSIIWWWIMMMVPNWTFFKRSRMSFYSLYWKNKQITVLTPISVKLNDWLASHLISVSPTHDPEYSWLIGEKIYKKREEHLSSSRPLEMLPTSYKKVRIRGDDVKPMIPAQGLASYFGRRLFRSYSSTFQFWLFEIWINRYSNSSSGRQLIAIIILWFSPETDSCGFSASRREFYTQVPVDWRFSILRVNKV